MTVKQILFYISCIMGIVFLSCAKSNKPDYKISEDETVTIELQYTAGTGYSWQWVNQDNVKHLDSVNVEYEYNSQFIGGAGTMKWQFKAKSKGCDTLTFMYKRAWEDAEIEKKEFVVKVK